MIVYTILKTSVECHDVDSKILYGFKNLDIAFENFKDLYTKLSQIKDHSEDRFDSNYGFKNSLHNFIIIYDIDKFDYYELMEVTVL